MPVTVEEIVLVLTASTTDGKHTEQLFRKSTTQP